MFPLGDFFKKSKISDSQSFSSEPSAPRPAEIGKLLSSDTILIIEPPEKKSELLKMMVQKICQKNPAIPLERAFQSVMEREKVTTTFMESGVGVPHARLPNLNQIEASLAIIPQGFLTSKGTGKKDGSTEPKTFFVFLFLSPEKQLTTHLQVLSKASWLFQNEKLKDQLLKTKNSSDALRLIQKCENEGPHGSDSPTP